ncbi:uncharacterized protein LOC132277329 [Cornus florida]|uniref:uncharacterized protein LOC132277329 n=1 Tax=Cornus florida TaxID=4283 RepID=UPI0028A283DE|nr:uncharacterized protein LOC132277329 [Cornus florida]
MEKFSGQLEEIRTLLSSNTKAHKPFAYSTLLHLQEQSSTDPSSIQLLADSSRALLSPILTDISDADEEIASQALKCLGFMMYHSSLVVAIPRKDANMIVDLLVKVILTTKMKSVCNLGVWCISIQQLNPLFLAEHFHSLLGAVVHALDNPIGSLSTTFEAIQAVMKLATQLSERMRDVSNIWAPPIYRRFVSIDKRERDMSERCFLKISSTIFPPTLALSKAVAIDMKKKMLPGMKELLNNGLKIQTMKAWGWLIRLLGPYAVKNRHLVNEILKIPEHTFSDIDPQVQIASLVAWEGLVDALIFTPERVPEINTAPEHCIQQVKKSMGSNSGTEADGFSKSIKLIMTPLIGIISSKCDVSVHSSCLNTWSYLLHKLDNFVNCPSVIKTVWEPIFEAVFRVGPESRNIWSWNFCLDLLDNFILARSKIVDDDLNNQVNGHSLDKTPTNRPPVSGKCSQIHYPIKCLPWGLSQLDFYIKMIYIIVTQGSAVTVPAEIRSLTCDAALAIFGSVLKGIQSVLKNPAIDYNEVMQCLNAVLRFIKNIHENVTSKDSDIGDLHHLSLQFVEIVAEELEPSMLGSPLYKVALDLKYIDNLQSVIETKKAKVLGICFSVYMDMVSPIVYLTTLYFCGVFTLASGTSKAEFILQGVHKYVKFILSSYDPLENLHTIFGLLYKHMGFNCLKIWISIAKSLKDYIDGVKDFPLLKPEPGSTGRLAICHLLSYPFVVCSCPQKQLTMVECKGPLESYLVSSQSQRKLELEDVVDVWKSLYVSVDQALQFESSTSKRFAEDLTSLLNGCLVDTSMIECGTELDPSINHHDFDLPSLYGNAVICVFEHILASGVSSSGSKDKDCGDYKRFSGINNCLEFAARFMMLSWTLVETNPPTVLVLTSRVFSALVRFVGCLYSKGEMLSFMQIISSPLLQWLSQSDVPYGNINHQLQLLWAKTLNCLQRSRPPIIFDSSFLKLQAPLLEKTLDHPNPAVSEPTITFWNSTYGEQIRLDYPESLLHVLDKLSRTRRLNLCSRSPPFSDKVHSSVEVITAPQRYRVIATQNRNSKRVELVEDTVNGLERNDKLHLSLKRKRPELTEHQKEVRRAQQGRERDCNGHGPGIRTYTGVDFSQGNESQESQEIRNAESILEMLRKTG